MRILMVMAYPGYLRYYGSVVKLLVERGHEVVLAFDNVQKQSEGLKALESVEGRVVQVGRWPTRDDVWKHFAGRLRGLIDYLRYLDPRFGDAQYLRMRMAKKLPPTFSLLTRIKSVPPPLLRFVLGTLEMCERAIPTSRRIEAFVRSVSPDVIVATPVVNPASRQVDLFKAAHAIGIRTVVGVASWDHLTTKGLIRVRADRVVVWNETQKREAVELHGVPPSRVVVTGAQPFDDWFDRQADVSYVEFCNIVGLDPSRPFILFVGSTASISAPDAEVKFVREWIQALRARPGMQDVGILVRPHPYNAEHWRTLDLSEFVNVSVWPRNGANPVDRRDRADYFASLSHATAVVGINTSAMVEASILSRPVLTVLTPEFQDTQSGTLHFHYLLAGNGGCATAARSLEEHASQLQDVLAKQGADGFSESFVRAFVRPHGLSTPATPLLVETIEELGRMPKPRPEGFAPWLWPLKVLLWVCARMIRTTDPKYIQQIKVKASSFAGRVREPHEPKRPESAKRGRAELNSPPQPEVEDASSRRS